MLDFLYTSISWVLLRWYQLFTFLGMDEKSGLTWAFSIIMLVVTARLLMFRFFVKQVHYQRRMQEMQPKIKKLQEKHKGDKASLQREMMALQQSEGFNPISGCLPMLLQIPIFISLFHVLKHISNSVGLPPGARGLTLYSFTEQQTTDAAAARLFNNAPLAASLRDSADKIENQLHGDLSTTRIVTIVLVIVSALATYLTQRAVIANQTTPPEGQAAMIQRLMLVGIPVSVLVSGFIFPIGVLLYWFTSNLWTMGQQYYIFRYHPHTPGATTGAADVPTGQTGKALAPKVGQKPISAKGTRPGAAPRAAAAGRSGASTATADGAAKSAGTTKAGATSNVNLSKSEPAVSQPADNTAGAAPAGPAQAHRGQRPSGNRPGNKRSPSKKRR
ncbi:MAG TPA: membrane protein insertase YidC [Jatrophihabitans sp.]|jgi:YidC/Oxa1 family membrane protein insertase|uniref:membrane protein insertase YidC n=1 Tax=Jatrophihabitans sp. TaxID=1932789 RepID=UPI002F22D81D